MFRLPACQAVQKSKSSHGGECHPHICGGCPDIDLSREFNLLMSAMPLITTGFTVRQQ